MEVSKYTVRCVWGFRSGSKLPCVCCEQCQATFTVNGVRNPQKLRGPKHTATKRAQEHLLCPFTYSFLKACIYFSQQISNS